jgi:hypothetical protein
MGVKVEKTPKKVIFSNIFPLLALFCLFSKKMPIFGHFGMVFAPCARSSSTHGEELYTSYAHT